MQSSWTSKSPFYQLQFIPRNNYLKGEEFELVSGYNDTNQTLLEKSQFWATKMSQCIDEALRTVPLERNPSMKRIDSFSTIGTEGSFKQR